MTARRKYLIAIVKGLETLSVIELSQVVYLHFVSAFIVVYSLLSLKLYSKVLYFL